MATSNDAGVDILDRIEPEAEDRRCRLEIPKSWRSQEHLGWSVDKRSSYDRMLAYAVPKVISEVSKFWLSCPPGWASRNALEKSGKNSLAFENIV